MSEYILEAKNISKRFGGVKALNNVSIKIRNGEVHCLAGENGSGKSTLIKIISGFYTPDEGELIIDGKSFSRISPDESIAEGIQVIYQDLSLFPNLTVMENLAFNNEIMSKRKLVNRNRMRQIATQALEKIGYNIDLDQILGRLSIADRQLIAIARALLYDAKLIIMDEPTTALTKHEVDKLFSFISKLTQQGIAILFVSHKLDEMFDISNEFTILRNGENIVSAKTEELDNDKFIYYMTGRTLTSSRYIPEDVGETCLEVKNLSLSGSFKNVCFEAKSGEILGITGLLGSGRRELALSLFGIMPYDSGEILVGGKETTIHSVSDAQTMRIGYVPEDRLEEGIFASQPMYKNITISSLDDIFVKSPMIQADTLKSIAAHWTEELSITSRQEDLPVQTLSGGNQQKVVLGRWLQSKPKILILNGPTVGVDIGAKFDIHKLMRQLSNTGMSIIIISDDIREIKSVCSRVLVMERGTLTRQYLLSSMTDAELDALKLNLENEA